MASMPLVLLERLPESLLPKQQTHIEIKVRRKRGKRNRRMFFNKIKQHRPNAPKCIRKCLKTPMIFGFPAASDVGTDPFIGFDEGSTSASFMKSVLMTAVIEDNFVLPSSEEPIKCISYGAHGVNIMKVLPFPRKPIRVLSLFDGLASGLVVLSNNLRLKLSAYFSSEIDGDAITVQRRRHCGKIIGLGDVRKLTSEVLDSLGDISLLIGGSPCDNLSLVNPLRAGLADESASGSLFFNFVVIRDYLMDKAMRNRRPFYWLFENTAKLEVSTQEAMTAALGCSPVMCCSSSYLPARRQRLFWGNTPYINEVAEEMRRRVRTTSMQDIIGPDRLPSLEIFPTITTNGSAKGKITAVYANGRADTLEISDYERLLGFTQSYTDVGRLSFSRRLRLLGKSWCIDVVTELLRPLVDLFECDISN